MYSNNLYDQLTPLAEIVLSTIHRETDLELDSFLVEDPRKLSGKPLEAYRAYLLTIERLFPGFKKDALYAFIPKLTDEFYTIQIEAHTLYITGALSNKEFTKRYRLLITKLEAKFPRVITGEVFGTPDESKKHAPTSKCLKKKTTVVIRKPRSTEVIPAATIELNTQLSLKEKTIPKIAFKQIVNAAVYGFNMDKIDLFSDHPVPRYRMCRTLIRIMYRSLIDTGKVSSTELSGVLDIAKILNFESRDAQALEESPALLSVGLFTDLLNMVVSKHFEKPSEPLSVRIKKIKTFTV